MATRCLHNFNYNILNFTYRTLDSPQVFLLSFRPKSVKIVNRCFLRHKSTNFPGRYNTTLRCSSQSCDGSGFDCRDYYNEEIREHFESPTSYNQNFEDDGCDDGDDDIIHNGTIQEARDEIESGDGSSSSYVGYYSSMSCWVSSKLELFGPSFFGMRPNPPLEYWPEDEGTKRSTEFALEVQRRRAITMVKQSNYLRVAGDFSYCSMRKVFSVTVFMIQEVLSYVLSIRESLYSEDLRKVMDRVQMEITYTFVWLFESVFARTPTLMVSVMLLLANFTAHSMADTANITTYLPTTGLVSYYEEVGGSRMDQDTGPFHTYWAQSKKSMGQSTYTYKNIHSFVALDPRVGWAVARGTPPLDPPLDVVVAELANCVKISNVVHRESPRCSHLLLSSALFLNHNPQVHDMAEEWFERAITMEPCDAKLRILYADFLWLVKMDLTSAEERYQEALEIDPCYDHTFKYATFLRETGSSDICFPLYDF